MTQQVNLPTSEREALRELQQRGVHEIHGISIYYLLDQAGRRQYALQQLRDAETAFQKAVSSNDESDVKSALESLSQALASLREVKYPEDEAFDLRRQVLAADITRAEALREAIEIWWWRRFTEHVATFHQHVGLPEGKALGKAQKALNEAKALLSDWPDRPTASHWREQADSSLNSMEEKLEKSQEGFLALRLTEANSWLDQARDYLGEGLTQNDRIPDAFAALACLTRAKVILDELEDGEPGLEMSGSSYEDGKNARSRLEELQSKTRQALPDQLSKQHLALYQNLQGKLRSSWEAWQQAHPQEDFTAFLAEQKDHRELTDQLRFYLYKDFTFKPDSWLEELILDRQVNLLRARRLLEDVRVYWTDDERERQPYIYWAWRRIKDAHSYNPDSQEIQKLYDDITTAWDRLQKQFKDNIAKVEQRLATVEGSSTAGKSEYTTSPTTRPEDVEKGLKEARKVLDESKRIIENQVEQPPEWTQKTGNLNCRLLLLEHLLSEACRIGSLWKKESDLLVPIKETEDFLSKQNPPDAIKAVLRASIQKRRVSSRDRPSTALEYHALFERF